MGLLIPVPANLPPQIQSALDEIIAPLQVWVGKQEGLNQALESATGGFASVPSGGVMPFAGDTVPSGWLLCDGALVSRADYANLFEAIGVKYGAGDGSTTFLLPDLRGRFILGTAASGTGSTSGGTGGAIDHTHSLSGSTATEAAHTHAVSGNTGGSSGTAIEVDANLDGTTEFTLSFSPPIGFPEDHIHSVSITSGAGSAHSHTVGTLATAAGNPPFMALDYIIRT